MSSKYFDHDHEKNSRASVTTIKFLTINHGANYSVSLSYLVPYLSLDKARV